MPIEQITVPIWVSLSQETRNKLRQIFFIPHSSHAEVVTDAMGNSKVISDGTTNEDLKTLSVERMRDFLGSAAINETVYDLFKRTVEKVEEVTNGTLEPKIENGSAILPTNTLKCPDCEYTHASKQGMRMHIYAKHTKKK